MKTSRPSTGTIRRALPWLCAALLLLAAGWARAVTMHPQTERPYLLSGPADKETIKQRLTVFAHPVSSILNTYLNGTEAQKQTASNSFFSGLPTTPYTSSRRVFEKMYEYDIVMALGYATPAQQQKMLDLSLPRVQAVMAANPGSTPPVDAPNGYTEDLMAIGLCALNFPDHPDAQAWLDKSVGMLTQQLDFYFPDGTALESPRYHDWMLLLLAEYLPALKRCTDVDLTGHPALERALEWLPRFSLGPFAIGDVPYSPPNGGDTTIGETYASFLPWAAMLRDHNPVLSGRLMHCWQLAGSPTNSGWVFPTTFPQIFDPSIAATPRAPAVSTYAPSFGEVLFRSETGTSDDFHATFRAGRRHTSHHNADHGHIDLIAFGVPLAIDSGSGPYDTGLPFPQSSMKNWNRQTMAHNTVRCVVPEPESTRDQSGVFQAFGSSSTVDYAAGSTSYGITSIRHVVFVKGDYMVVWDQITAAQYADWFFHTPADTTRPDGGLEWQANKVISHTKWGVDLDIHFLLPSGPLPAPTVPTDNLSIDYTTKNGMASQHPDPGTATLFTRQGDGRFGEWTDPNNPNDVGRDPWALKWQRYLSVRSPTADGDFLTILHPRKVGVTPALTSTLISSSPTGVSLTVNYNGRVDTILIDTSGATITRGTDAPVQFAKTWPQSGVSGGARLVKANESTTTLTAAVPTTGTVDVTLGTLALGNSDRIPDAAPVAIRGSGTLNLGIHGETAGPLLMDNGILTGTGTLRVGPVASYGGKWNAPVISTGILTVHGGKLDLGGRTHLAAGLTVGGLPLPAGTYTASNLPTAFSGSGNLVVSSGIKFWNAAVDNQWNTPTANWTGQTWNNGDSAVIAHTGTPSNIQLTQAVNAAAVLIGNGTNHAAYTLGNAGGSLTAGTVIVQGSGGNDFGAGTATPARFDNLTLDVTGNLGLGRWPLVIGGTSTIHVGGVIGGGGIATSPDWGTLTIQENAVVTATGGINGNTEAWALNLDGGTLFTPSIQASDRALVGSSARLTFNGTTVVATSNNSAFVTVGANHLGSNSALVGNGGAIIDSNGKTIGIGVNLKASGTGGLTKRGAGTLTLSGANTYTGGTTIQGSGRLDLASSSAASNGTIFLQSTQTGTGVTLGIAGGITVDNPMAMDAATGREWIHFTGDGDAIVNGDMTISNGGSALVINSAKSSGTAIWNGDITGAGFTGSLSLRGNAGQTGRFNGVITINSNLDHNGGANWVINATGSDYAATRFQNNGSILLGGNNGLDTSARVAWSSATINGDLDLNGFHASVSGLDRPTTTSDPIVTNNGASDAILTLAALEADRTFAGRIADGISNKISLVMNSPGRVQTLAGANTYTGATSVTGGTLRVTGSLAGTSSVTIAPDGILDQQGPISTGAFTHAAGGILKLNTAASLTVAGEVSLSGTLDLSAPAGLAPGATFTIVNKTGPGAVSGQFAGLPEGSVFQAAGYDWHVSYTGGDGNDVVVTIATILQSWRFLHFGTIENTGEAADLADSNNDGEANLLEFATGQNPHAATLTTTTLTKNGTSLEFTYTRSHAAMTAGITFAVEWSDTLTPGSWSDAGVTEQILSDDDTVQSIKASIPAGDGPARFVHLRVTAPPEN